MAKNKAMTTQEKIDFLKLMKEKEGYLSPIRVEKNGNRKLQYDFDNIKIDLKLEEVNKNINLGWMMFISVSDIDWLFDDVRLSEQFNKYEVSVATNKMQSSPAPKLTSNSVYEMDLSYEQPSLTIGSEFTAGSGLVDGNKKTIGYNFIGMINIMIKEEKTNKNCELEKISINNDLIDSQRTLLTSANKVINDSSDTIAIAESEIKGIDQRIEDLEKVLGNYTK